MALSNNVPVGCCALLSMEENAFELAKMTVAEGYRGQGHRARAILPIHHCASERPLGAARLYLETQFQARQRYPSVRIARLPPPTARAAGPVAVRPRECLFLEMLL